MLNGPAQDGQKVIGIAYFRAKTARLFFCCPFAIHTVTIFVVAIAVFAVADDVNRIVTGDARVTENLDLRAKPRLVTRIEDVPVFGASPDGYLLVIFLDVGQFIRGLLTSPAYRRLMRSQNSAEKVGTFASPCIVKNSVVSERAGFAVRTRLQSSRCTIACIFPNRSNVPNSFAVVAVGQTTNGDFLDRNISPKRMPLLIFSSKPLLVGEESGKARSNKGYEKQPEYGIAKRALIAVILIPLGWLFLVLEYTSLRAKSASVSCGHVCPSAPLARVVLL